MSSYTIINVIIISIIVIIDCMKERRYML